MPAKKPRAKGPVLFTDAHPFVWPTLNAASDKYKAEGEFNVKVRLMKESDSFAKLNDKLGPMLAKVASDAEVLFKQLKPSEQKRLKSVTVNDWYAPVYDEDNGGEETGEVTVKFTVKATKGPFKNGKFAGKFGATRPTVIDAGKNVIIQGFEFKMTDTLEEAKALTFKPIGPRIWGGTTGRVKFEVGLNKDDEPGYWMPATATCGLSLRPVMVQVLELAETSGSDNDTSGFDEEEGYRAESKVDDSTESETADEDDSPF